MRTVFALVDVAVSFVQEQASERRAPHSTRGNEGGDPHDFSRAPFAAYAQKTAPRKATLAQQKMCSDQAAKLSREDERMRFSPYPVKELRP